MPLVAIASLSKGLVRQPRVGTTHAPVPLKTLPSTALGQMPVLMTMHGGVRGALDCMEGLVRRNERSIQEGRLSISSAQAAQRLPVANDGIWRDAPMAHLEGCITAGTLAAWKAAEERIQGRAAFIGLVNGIPRVVLGGDDLGNGAVAALDLAVKTTAADTAPFYVAGFGDTEGRTTIPLRLTLDDVQAYAVTAICTTLAEHNAVRIKVKGLPRLYKTSVRYQPEGIPELWWDAEEILLKGYEDCDGLSAYRAGELIAKENLDADVWCRLITKPSTSMGGTEGGRLFHAVTRVRVPDATCRSGYRYEYCDPSARLGMPVPDWYKSWCAARREAGQDLG